MIIPGHIGAPALHAHLFARVEATTKQNRQSNSPTTASPSA